ncbi:DUF1592 domain-containing protein [Planctellipticum variicoloris]|uniref:DUF1592 domain-containing protein n=1 Tax=Planctellipticum variicoloris TaxID=3064265 RepID=UPI003013CF85|nr:DUF1592 domain-containing protein [Planctomycetaceae bacterium SH412]
MPGFARVFGCALLVVCLQTTVPAQTPQPQADPGAQLDYQKDVLPLLTKFCGDCHSGDQPDAGVAFERLNIELARTRDRATWKKVFTQLDAHIMPPADAEQPSAEERARMAAWVQSHAVTVICDGPAYPGRVTLRRLNRSEYNRTIRDLIGIDYRPADSFPSDDVGYGFDNIGDVLTLPPVLLERYLDAADEVVRRAILVPELDFAPVVTKPGKVLASVSEAGDEFEFVANADYLFRVQAYGDQAGLEPTKMAFLLDGKDLQTVDVPATSSDPGTYELTARVEPGKHRVTVKFLNDYYKPDDPDPKLKGDRNLHVQSVSVIGPIGALPETLPESHRRLIPHTPAAGADRNAQLAAVRANLTPLLPQAFRRPMAAEEVERYVGIANLVLDDKASFERAMQVAVQAVLVSPRFLFRVEQDPPAEGPIAVRDLDDFELATRISYFLWSSQPDAELTAAASAGTLKDPAVLEQQIRRMLQDPRSDALVENFAGQWLQLRNLQTISMDTKQFPEFNPELRVAMRRETELLFTAIIREDRSVLELLTADFTYLNEPLAKLYGIEGISGNEFQRVSLTGSPRGGLLGQASILTVTSNPTRTSPVKRGKWILENLLAAPPPPPPPNVPSLEAQKEETKKTASLRERLELHRSNPACAACHRLMDPLGFGLENFDAIGKWRDKDHDSPVDPRGELPGGRTFSGPVELRQILIERKAEFRRCVATKLLTYALGRGLEYFDECSLNEVTAKMESRDDKFSVLVLEIVKSTAFRQRARTAMPE